MPDIQFSTSPEPKAQRYQVTATGETGIALSGSNGGRSIGRLATIGLELNVQLIDICDEKTGEVRTYRAEFLEKIDG